MDYRKFVDEDVRVIILRALADEPDARLNETLLLRVAESFGHRKTQSYLRDQLDFLKHAGAVTLDDVRGVVIATLTRKGQEHTERRAFIPGVAKPELAI